MSPRYSCGGNMQGKRMLTRVKRKVAVGALGVGERMVAIGDLVQREESK